MSCDCLTVSTVVLEDTMESITPVKEKKAVNLKPKELDVLGLIAKGYTNADIADAMCLSPAPPAPFLCPIPVGEVAVGATTAGTLRIPSTVR